MVRNLTCPQGHRWQVPSDPAAATSMVTTCPVCGGPGKDGAPPATELGLAASLNLPGGEPGTAVPTSATLGPEPESPVARPVAIPGYEIVGELGRGGMGVVYKARQVGLDRLVALKMLVAGPHAHLSLLARFRTEAVARLKHPNIVQIYDVGQADGLPYFALEHLDGGSLAECLASRPTRARDGYARLTWKYDGRGNLVEERYFGPR